MKPYLSRGLSPERLARLALIEEAHFWFVGRRRLVEELLCAHLSSPNSLVVDLGCGTGSHLPLLKGMGHRPVGLEMMREGLVELAGRGGDWLLLQADAEDIPIGDGVADCILALDVLEHVDDHRTLGEIKRILKPGGVLVATVPAFQFLWSYRDKAAGHRRRYTKRLVDKAIKSAGFTVADMLYYQAVLFPLVLASRFAGKFIRSPRDAEEMPPALLNSLFTAINNIEVALACRGIRLGWGSTIVVVARKPA